MIDNGVCKRLFLTVRSSLKIFQKSKGTINSLLTYPAISTWWWSTIAWISHTLFKWISCALRDIFDPNTANSFSWATWLLEPIPQGNFPCGLRYSCHAWLDKHPGKKLVTIASIFQPLFLLLRNLTEKIQNKPSKNSRRSARNSFRKECYHDDVDQITWSYEPADYIKRTRWPCITYDLIAFAQLTAFCTELVTSRGGTFSRHFRLDRS